jgi:hypothetical protein
VCPQSDALRGTETDDSTMGKRRMISFLPRDAEQVRRLRQTFDDAPWNVVNGTFTAS